MTHFGYLKYVVRHRWYVFVECCKLGIPWRGIVHDLSKFRWSEWKPYADQFYGDYGYNFDTDRAYPFPMGWSENTWRRHLMEIHERTRAAFDLAWLKHQKVNPHHWQWWVLTNDTDGTYPLPMPDVYRREMLADWRGAGAAMGKPGDTPTWYYKNKDKMTLHPGTREWIEQYIGPPPMTAEV